MVVDTIEPILLSLVGHTVVALESQLGLQADCTTTEHFVFTENLDDSSNWDSIFRNMDYLPVEELY